MSGWDTMEETNPTIKSKINFTGFSHVCFLVGSELNKVHICIKPVGGKVH